MALAPTTRTVGDFPWFPIYAGELLPALGRQPKRLSASASTLKCALTKRKMRDNRIVKHSLMDEIIFGSRMELLSVSS